MQLCLLVFGERGYGHRQRVSSSQVNVTPHSMTLMNRPASVLATRKEIS